MQNCFIILSQFHLRFLVGICGSDSGSSRPFSRTGTQLYPALMSLPVFGKNKQFLSRIVQHTKSWPIHKSKYLSILRDIDISSLDSHNGCPADSCPNPRIFLDWISGTVVAKIPFPTPSRPYSLRFSLSASRLNEDWNDLDPSIPSEWVMFLYRTNLLLTYHNQLSKAA